MKHKVYLLLFISILISAPGFGQNLVNNPGFENITGSCSFAGYSSLIDWYNPDPIDSCSTPDWFATCVSSPFTQAPNSQMGYQQPHGGNSYAGFISYDQSSSSYREYVEGSLSAALVSGQSYKATIYLSLANSSHFSINHLGIYFSNTQVTTTAYNCPELYPLAYTPQVDSTFTITDTANWVELSWHYIATGGERYLTIGNFHNDAATTATAVPHAFSFTPFAYYFIDDVSVVQDTTGDTTLPESINVMNIARPVLSVYPSPTKQYVKVEMNTKETMQYISIINSLGAVVYERRGNTSKETIELEGIAAGIYTVRVKTAAGVRVRKLEVLK